MGQQSVRQAARKAALEVRAARRVARAQRERRLDTLAVELHVPEGKGRGSGCHRAPGRPRAARNDWRRRLTLPEAVDWCGAGLTLREASRLRRLLAGEAVRGRRWHGHVNQQRRRGEQSASDQHREHGRRNE